MVALALCSALRCAALREVSYVLNALIEKSQSVDGDRQRDGDGEKKSRGFADATCRDLDEAAGGVRPPGVINSSTLHQRRSNLELVGRPSRLARDLISDEMTF